MSDDGELVARIVAGDWTALDQLMLKYDRLVRFTILKTAKQQCQHDPQWLDSVASKAWMGFVRSLQRDAHSRPKSLKAYLVQIARNQSITTLRAAASGTRSRERDLEPSDTLIEANMETVSDLFSTIETLGVLRSCIEELPPQHRVVVSQLERIVDRRWKEASEILECSESTLRSRWKLVLECLKDCLLAKMGGSFAPGDSAIDSFVGGGQREDELDG